MNDPSPQAWSARLVDVSRRSYGRILQWLGRPAAQQSEPLVVHNDLGVASAARRAQRYRLVPLADTLLTAFSVAPLAAGDAGYIGREAELKRLLAALEMWRAGRSSIIAITARQGYGITSFLQQLALQVNEGEIFRYGKLERRPLDVSDTLAMLSKLVGCRQPIDSLDKLVEYINGLSPRVFALDNGHFFACRIMGSEEAIRCFGAIMIATQNRHFWVVGCEQFAWRRLGYVFHAQRYFSEAIELPAFTEAELGQCFTARLQKAGMALEADPEGEPAVMPALVADVLTDLGKLSEGKPDLAFFYFLDALFVAEDSQQLSTRPLIPLDFSILKALVNEELFTLTEVAANGQLSVADHRRVFRASHEKSWLLLERLYHLCLLERIDPGVEDSVYRLMPLYSNVIGKFLTNANYLY